MKDSPLIPIPLMPKEYRSAALHYNLVKAVVNALQMIFESPGGGKMQYADAVVRKLLKSNPKWGANDRKFLARTVYEMVRWWRKLWYISGKDPSPDEQSLWTVAGIHLVLAGFNLPPWKEFLPVAQIQVNARLEEADRIRAIRESIPDWLDERGWQELGAQWERELHILNTEAPVVIRVNTLKTHLDALQEKLNMENTGTSRLPSGPDALQLDERKNIFSSESFRQGLFEVQDTSSQEVAYFMNVNPGMRVIDACAGGGGKALHIAALMHNKGRIIALDIHEWKLKELRKRAARAGADIIETRTVTTDKVIKRLEKSADRLLLDVPCSGLGTLRRNPDIKWKLTAEVLERIGREQYGILTAYCSMVKPGGIVIYSTCSILPSENEGVIDRFTREYGNFRKVGERKILPSESGADGFYMVALERLDSGKSVQ